MGYLEDEPLLKPHQTTQQFSKDVPVAVPVQEAPPRTWDGRLLACFGNCDLPGWATFGLVYTCPCVAVGHNIKRALKGSLVLHALIYFTLFLFTYYMYIGANEAELRACPNGPMDEAALWGRVADEHHARDTGNRRLLHKHDHDEAHPPHPPHPHPPHYNPIAWVDLPEECQAAIITKHTTAVLCLVSFLVGVIYCACNRTAIRKRFGIAGSRFGDFCTWCWCAPCALCQETRTLWRNNVHEGVWHGPTQLPMVSPPPHQTVLGTPAA